MTMSQCWEGTKWQSVEKAAQEMRGRGQAQPVPWINKPFSWISSPQLQDEVPISTFPTRHSRETNKSLSKLKSWAGDVPQPVKWLLCKGEGQSSDPQNPSQGQVGNHCCLPVIPVLGRTQGIPGVSRLARLAKTGNSGFNQKPYLSM